MPRPTTIPDAQILDAARAVFLANGFRATTAEVAKAAGVAEGTLFKRFRSKEELFWTALQPALAAPPWLRPASSPVTDARRELSQLLLDLFVFLRTAMPLLLMRWSTPLSARFPEVDGTPLPLLALQGVTRQVERWMAQGLVAKVPADKVARLILGSVQNLVFFEVLFGQPADPQRDLPAMAELIWGGIAPRPASKGAARSGPSAGASRTKGGRHGNR